MMAVCTGPEETDSALIRLAGQDRFVLLFGSTQFVLNWMEYDCNCHNSQGTAYRAFFISIEDGGGRSQVHTLVGLGAAVWPVFGHLGNIKNANRVDD